MPVTKKQRRESRSAASTPQSTTAAKADAANDDDVAMDVDEETVEKASSSVNGNDSNQDHSETASKSSSEPPAQNSNASGGGGKVKKSNDTASTSADGGAASSSSSNKKSSASSSTPKTGGASSSSSTAAAPNSGRTSATPGSSMDAHPYARSSVIEVLHGLEDPSSDDDWWSEDSDVEEVEDGDGVYNNVNEDGGGGGDDPSPASAINLSQHHHLKHHLKKGATIRLCDIIDRVSVGENKWRYYVHYRDFNRRMDEWVSMERIVSPPSVGNAKARAIKKEEEKQKRKQQRLEEKQQNDLTGGAGVDLSAPRASRRRSSVQGGSGGGVTPVGVGDEGDSSRTPRRGSMRRRTSQSGNMADDSTVVASNQDKTGSGMEADTPPPLAHAAEKGIVAIPTAAVTHHTVGEHVVATIPAQELDEHEGLDEASLREHEEVTKVKNVAFVELGPHQMETWYFSPLPKELLSEKGLIEVLYVCEFTFSLFSRKSELQRFQARLPTDARHPPGNEIYRNGNLSMFEIDGFSERIYCQNLCYIAKLFLDHKTLYFDVDPFLFYVLCEIDDRGFHPVGYYSKEKYSDVGYNLACILTFPSHQRKGYGRFLIAFSYELSKKEEKVGSPEKPMSDLGQQAYKPYWASTIVDFLLYECGDASSMSIMDISKRTSIMAEDIVFTLNQLGILKIINGVYFVAAEESMLKTLAKKFPVKEPRVDPSKLHWTPYITDVKRDKFSIHSKRPSVDGTDDTRRSGGFP